MYAIFDKALKNIVVSGDLLVFDATGRGHRYGDSQGLPVAFRFTSRTAPLKIALDADLYLGEAFMNGDIEMQEGTIYDLLALLLRNIEGRTVPAALRYMDRVRKVLKRVYEYNPTWRAKANVAHHYDLSDSLYDLFLDGDRQYSCAYFESPDATLEEAQLAKKRHLAAKLDVKPGMRVLDIGSGWGGLGLYLAEQCGANVTGVTLSEEQHRVSNERALQRGLFDRVKFQLLDYRHLNEPFDRIVSVGMFEHVGVVHYAEFFRKIRQLLKPDGVALLHSINRSDGPGATSRWINKYIFPGGSIPALSEVVPQLEKYGLYLTDVEILRLHYAETLRHWRERFLARRDEAKRIYDERFCRMWEFYLAASETAFRYSALNNFQIQFTRSQHALPITRNYMIEAEDRLRAPAARERRLKSVPAE
ncbi:cyclopropane-fatty-acyl-phospholipid synthase family protein [soil metagenome]